MFKREEENEALRRLQVGKVSQGKAEGGWSIMVGGVIALRLELGGVGRRGAPCLSLIDALLPMNSDLYPLFVWKASP
jgi:hypothetical protein